MYIQGDHECIQGLSGNKPNVQELRNRLDEDFGTLGNDVYKRVKVFNSDEEKDEFLSGDLAEVGLP